MKFIELFIMMTGMLCTLFPKFPGTFIILLGVLLYGLATTFATFESWLVVTLLLLMLIAEFGGRGLRVYLTKKYPISRTFTVNSVVGNLAGIVVADALLGFVVGAFVWEMILGKTVLPHFELISKVIIRLVGAALLRFVCALIMVILVSIYIL